VSGLIDIEAYLMPPASLEVWGGNDPKQLRLLSRITPEQPSQVKPAYQKVYELKFKPVAARYFKIVANPVSKLPKWHPGKGQKGWFFTDEVFVN